MATLRVYFRTLGENGLAVLRILTSITFLCTSTQVSLLRETENFAKKNCRYNQVLCPIGKNVKYCKIQYLLGVPDGLRIVCCILGCFFYSQ